MAETLNHMAKFRTAIKIVNSDPVLAVFAAPEWDELHEDGKVWIAEIVQQARKELEARHDARVSELLAANNREVDRRRAAEAKLRRIAEMAEVATRLAASQSVGLDEAFPMGPLVTQRDFAIFGAATTEILNSLEAARG